MANKIKGISRTASGEIAFAYDDPAGHVRGVALTEDDARAFAAQLSDAIGGAGEAVLRAEILKLRRDQQQIMMSLQEIARKVARHEQLAVMTSVTIDPAADLETAIAAAHEFSWAIKAQAGIRC